MKHTKGLFVDCAEMDQPEGTYRFAKNIIDSNLQAAIENEDGFVDLDELTPYTVIGTIVVQDDIVVFSTDNTNSEIGLITFTDEQTPVYTTVYNNSELNFATSAPIKGEFRKDINNERIVAWIDDNNSPRIISIDDTSYINNVTDLEVFPDINNPTLSTRTINDTGGALKVGGLTPITRYRNEDGSTTPWFVHDFTFFINGDSKSSAFNLNAGDEPGFISNKSVQFTLTGVDTRFNFIDVGYIQTVNNIVTAVQVTTRSTSTSLNLIISGNENTTDVTLDEILTPTAIYTSAKAITQLAGRLYLANLSSAELPDLDSVAFNVKIDYTSSLVNVVSNTGSHKDTLPPTFLPGEVYAFYLGVELKKGGWVYYHIPGRTSVLNETSTVTSNGLTYKRYQVDNTTDRTGFSAPTNMGYWENVNELYPNTAKFIAAGLANQPVRHHRFPLISHLTNTTYVGNSTVGITQLPKLGINVSNVIIPPAIQSQIKRWKIFYAKKDAQNSLVAGSDLLQLNATSDNPLDAGKKWSSGGNWTTYYPGDAGYEFNAIDRTSARGHSLDLSQNKNTVPDYAIYHYRLRRTGLNVPYSTFRSNGGTLTISGAIDGRRSSVSSAVIDYTVPAVTTRIINTSVQKLNNFTYLPNNALNGEFLSAFNEESFVYSINFPLNSLEVSELFVNDLGGGGASSAPFSLENQVVDPANGFEETYYVEYFKLLASVHSSYQGQDVIPTLGYAAPTATTLSTEGGDGFMCYLSYTTAAPIFASSAGAEFGDNQCIRMWRGYIGYSRYNLNYRYEETGNLSSLFHGKTNVRTLFQPNVGNSTSSDFTGYKADYVSLLRTTSPLNEVLYDSSFNVQNIFSGGVIYSDDIINPTTFPNTIIYSPIQNEESKEFTWRTFLSGDRYTMTKNRGDIINIQGFKNRELILHTEDSIFRTRTDINAGADGENIFFKSADLFELPPEELQPSASGYGGTQHKFACTLTKFGYFYPNNKQGKVFLYTGESLDEVSSNGMRTFFRDFMFNDSDNPFTDYGYSVGFDEKTNRILLTNKSAVNPWTLSYNPLKKTWISYHDYIPDHLVSLSNNSLYSFHENKLYLNNPIPNNIVKGLYYELNPQASYIDIIFNPEPTRDKQFIELEWITECYPVIQISGQQSNNLDYGVTLTDVTITSKDYCTGKVGLSATVPLTLYASNIRNVGRTWYFNSIRDISIATNARQGFSSSFNVDTTKLNTNMAWYDRRKITDKFVICRLEYNNIVNNRILLLDSKISYRYSR